MTKQSTSHMWEVDFVIGWLIPVCFNGKSESLCSDKLTDLAFLYLPSSQLWVCDAVDFWFQMCNTVSEMQCPVPKFSLWLWTYLKVKCEILRNFHLLFLCIWLHSVYIGKCWISIWQFFTKMPNYKSPIWWCCYFCVFIALWASVSCSAI